MKIKNHRLFHEDDSPFPYVESPNRGGTIQPRFLIIHFTAGRSAQSSIDWLTNSAAKASAHVVIGRDGLITQLVPFNRRAWHAGRSSWRGLDGMNDYSIGIELDNAGELTHQGNQWVAWFGQKYMDSDVLEAAHKHDNKISGWHMFTADQIEATVQLGLILADRYHLEEAIGHEDVAPGRKRDPGPAFPLASVAARIFGREHDGPNEYETTVRLNIREGPGTSFPTLAGSPLALGTRLKALDKRFPWFFVETPAPPGGEPFQGWVHGDYLLPVP